MNKINWEILDELIARFYELDHVILHLIQFFASIAITIGSPGLYGLVNNFLDRKNLLIL